MSVFTAARGLHIAAGTVALLSMFVPLFTKKGGRAHRRGGWVYVGAMAVVATTALVMGPIRVSEGNVFGAFLAYVALLAVATGTFGLRATRPAERKRKTPSSSPIDLGVGGGLVALSLATSAFGLSRGDVLISTFPAIGLFLGMRQIRYWRTAPTTPRHHWVGHLGGMLASSIATVTAFVVTALPRAVGPLPVVYWFVPTFVGGPLIVLFSRRARAGAL